MPHKDATEIQTKKDSSNCKPAKNYGKYQSVGNCKRFTIYKQPM